MLNDKIALITGASRGIGRAILEGLMEDGATVIGTATSESGAAAITEAIKAKGGKGEGVVLNIGDKESINALVAHMKATYPEGPHILVNNAGITRDNLMLRMKEEEWDDVINTNLTGIFRLTQACMKPMLKSRWGRIINISSVSGLMGNPGQCNYSAAKAGLIGFTKSLALEIASRNITVNAVAPGYIGTDMVQALGAEINEKVVSMIPTGRMGEPSEIAAAVRFLASKGASYVTGTVINVSGGLYM
ncbi:MAG: 3-oxoacyl-ACP reductase FabG [Gammaproteobacteria bacterium]